jgi:hypothetical protein
MIFVNYVSLLCRISFSAVIALCAVFAVPCSLASAQEAPAVADPPTTPPAAPSAERYGVSPLILAGYSDGIVAGAQWDHGIFALRATAGYMPLLLILADEETKQFDRLELINSAQVNADVLLLPITAGKTSRLGLSLGYRYNTALRHGVALGGQVEAELSDAVTVLAMLNFVVFPEGNQLARDALGDPPGVDFNFPFGAGFQGGMGLGLKF